MLQRPRPRPEDSVAHIFAATWRQAGCMSSDQKRTGEGCARSSREIPSSCWTVQGAQHFAFVVPTTWVHYFEGDCCIACGGWRGPCLAGNCHNSTRCIVFSAANAATHLPDRCSAPCASLRNVTPILHVQEGLFRELNPGPLAPEARIMPLDQAAMNCQRTNAVVCAQ